MWDSKSNAFFRPCNKNLPIWKLFFYCAQTRWSLHLLRTWTQLLCCQENPQVKKVPSNPWNGFFQFLCTGFLSPTSDVLRRAWWGLRDLVSPPEVSVLRCHLDEDHETQQKNHEDGGSVTLRKGEIISVYQTPRQHESFGYEILTFRCCELFGFVDKSRETVLFMNIIFCLTTNWSIHWRSLRFRRAIYSTPLTTRSHAPNSVSRQLGVLASRRRYVLLGTCPSRLCSCWLGWSSPVFAWLMMVQRRYRRNLLNLCFWGAFSWTTKRNI